LLIFVTGYMWLLAVGGNLLNFVGLDCTPKMPVLNLPRR
jgi:hypothetical protein